MKKILKVAIIGCGGRGTIFGELMKARKDEFEISAVCDINAAQIEKIKKILELDDSQCFTSEEEFLSEKRGDIMVVATFDTVHVRQCIRAMELGCDVLLEKPISDSREEIENLLAVQKRTGRTVAVCHELRYGPGFEMVKTLVEQGTIGTLLTIDAMERVAYWHQAQAYVRIQSERNDVTHPTILAKCCHDLDLVQSYAGAECDTVTSVGGLSFFRAECAPKDAADFCLDCPHMESCPYSAKKIYIDMWHERGCPEFDWPFNKVSLIMPTTEENLYKGIRTSYFGKCVFKCGNEVNDKVVDHQLVQMQFKNGVVATLKMTFAQTPGRRINLFGTYGEILFDERPNTIEIRKYGCEPEIIYVDKLVENGMNHGGGDHRLVSELYDIVMGNKQNRTSLTESAESHLIGIAAEESRKNGGTLVRVH